ncbi:MULTISPECIES: cupin domain-containing protein [Hydrogenibacillus]|uniref:Cupin domain-containing protein n=1 Tax=Hydrogenibacillus schlegelii TaxID=1484 RepID=A0A947GAI0_HYDSH|nr:MULTISPECIES: cupin domain-containing protein [Hydrogenibacillus]MBT9283521.1 cupin domain-containing protein [Hydrogenibacillus schlegelii]QZA33165.1 cupin domain-containing protein [Hydrogenibacillus sp. N12]
MPQKMLLSEAFSIPADRPFRRIWRRDDPRTDVLIGLKPAQRIPEHSHPGSEVTLLMLQGKLQVTLSGEIIELSVGELLRASGDDQLALDNVGEIDAYVLVILQEHH